MLGVEQSGHVAGVGFDLYVRLVGEAVEAYRAAFNGETVTTEEVKDVRIDLPVDAHLPPEYINSDRLRLEAYRRLAAAPDEAAVRAVIDELTDRYGPLPEPAGRLVAVARLRLLCRAAGITEVAAASATTLRLSPMTLPDSAQLRLKRMHPSAGYRATTATVQVPIPRVGGAARRWGPADPRCGTGADGGRSDHRVRRQTAGPHRRRRRGAGSTVGDDDRRPSRPSSAVADTGGSTRAAHR